MKVNVSCRHYFKLRLNAFLSGVHSIAALKGPEDYQTLKDGFAPVWTKINDLIRDGLAENQ